MKASYLFIFSALMLTAGSCSIFKPSEKAEAPTVAVKSVPNKNIPVGRTTIPAPPEIAVERPSTETLTGGRWLIAGVGSKTIVAEDDAPYIIFEAGTGRFYASNGCNIYNGDYIMRADGAFVLSNVASTRRYCPNEESSLIASYLNAEEPLFVDMGTEGHDTYIYLRTPENKVVMTLRRDNMEFLNGNWQVVAINGERVNDEECNIFFDIRELKMHGNTGCNYINGTLYIDPNRSNALDVSNIISTRMACPKRDQEMNMIVALESTVSAATADDNGNTALLMDGAGRELLKLKRINNSDED